MSTSLERRLHGHTRPARKDADGTRRCRWCEGPVVSPRRTFCGDECVHEFKLRTQPQYLREQVFKRDRGVCALCRVDTEAMHGRLKALQTLRRSKFLETIKAAGIPLHRIGGSLWDADHVTPVVEGGGTCGLENMRTLCIPCHQDQTTALAGRRRKTP